MEIPKNIFFYWDSLEIPREALDNVKNYKEKNNDFNVQILNDEDINKYKNEFGELIKLFHLATIAALKSDIIRFIYLYKEGGIWIDMNTTLLKEDSIKILYDRYKQFDFVISILPQSDNELKTSALISKPNSRLAYETIREMTEKLKKHYEIEKNSEVYIPYNYFLFIAPVVFYQLLEYKHYADNLEFIKDCENNIITLKSSFFHEYNCGIMDVKELLGFYRCNMSHHHGINFHKHWSVVQKTQKLFTRLNISNAEF
jgi:hypothetical protein